MKPVEGQMKAMKPMTPQLMREAMGCFATGVAIVTTLGPDGEPIGLTVDSFNSVSMDPPLILWSLGLKAPSLPAFRSHPAFVVNILSSEQLDLCRQFAVSGADKFANVRWEAGLHGAPVLNNNHATLQCLNYRQYEGGDHEIFLGEVAEVTVGADKPLVYHRGKFGEVGGITSAT
jgi:flavin reductase (DIM6/NTAB) family NADH-FMN oxidoreductase RutF